jgi:hypothetical protein
MQLDQTIADIRFFHRQRVFAMEQRKRSDLAIGSFLRTVLGWRLDLPSDERSAIAKRAAFIMSTVEAVLKQEAKAEDKRKPVEGADDPDVVLWRNVVAASVKGRASYDAVEATSEKEMIRLARTLPVWGDFAEGVRGFGALGLAIITAEAGDLAGYPKKGHLWKRMGVAQIDGVRQGGLSKSAPAEKWIEHGYNRQRRSRMFVIGDSLIKAQGPYREVYLARKTYEIAKAQEMGLTVAPAAKIPAKRKAEFISDGHIHRKAQRFMEQRLLRDLWQAWKNEGKASLMVADAA